MGRLVFTWIEYRADFREYGLLFTLILTVKTRGTDVAHALR